MVVKAGLDRALTWPSLGMAQKLWALALFLSDEGKIGTLSMAGQMEMGQWKPRGTLLILYLVPQINLITRPYPSLWVSWKAPL